MKRQLSALALATIILSASCKDDDKNNMKFSQKDMDFMAKATYINHGEVASGNLAVTKAINPAVKNYGSMMIEDHSNAHLQLTSVASSGDYILPSETDQEHKNKANTLMGLSGDAFDSTYLYMMVEGHDKAIALHQDEIQNGDNSSVKQYAQNNLGAIQHHRAMADSLAHALYPQ